MLATNLSEANGPDDKLRMAFKMYDKDSSGNVSISKRPFTTIILKMTENAPSYFTAGTIEIAEMTEIVVNLFELEGIEKVRKEFIQRTFSWLLSKETAVSKAKNIFNLLDVNGDGKMKQVLKNCFGAFKFDFIMVFRSRTKMSFLGDFVCNDFIFSNQWKYDNISLRPVERR